MGDGSTKVVYNQRTGRNVVYGGQRAYNPQGKSNPGDVWGTDIERHGRGDQTPDTLRGEASALWLLLMTLLGGKK